LRVLSADGVGRRRPGDCRDDGDMRTSYLSWLALAGQRLAAGGTEGGEPQRQKRDSQHAITSNYLKINVSGSDPKLITARLFINVIICTQSVEAVSIHQHPLYTPAIRLGIILR